MRKWGLLALGAALGLVACTSLLGDFTVGDGGTTDGGNEGGGNDVNNPDSPSSNDGGADADADAAPPLKLMNCAVNTQQVTALKFAAATSVDDGDRIFVYQLGQNKPNRAFIVHNQGIDYTQFNDNDQSAIFTPFNLTGGVQILNSARYQTPSGNGTVFLTWNSPSNVLGTVLFDDGATVPVVGPDLVGATEFPTNNGSNVKGTIDVLDSTQQDFVFAIQVTTDGTNYTLWVGHARNGNPVDSSTFAKIDSNFNPDLPGQSIAHDATNAYFIWPPSGGGGSTGPAPIYTMNIQTWALTNTNKVQPDAGFYLPFAGTSGSPGTVDIAYLQGDITNQNAIPQIYSKGVPAISVNTFNPATLTGYPIDFTTLPVNKSVAHWSVFPAEDDMIAAARPLKDNVPGVNILWFDSLGRARAIISESDGGGGFPSTLVNTVDMTFSNGAPSVVLATFRVAWIQGQGNQSNPPTFSALGQCTSF